MHLLVIDDDAELRDLLVRSLTRDGHVVKACASVTTGRRILAEDRPDLVVLDLSLPDGNGIELCRELREASNPIPVLVLTAHSEVATRVGSLDAGADDFLGKPFAVAELRARVRALGRRRGGGTRAFVVERGELSLDFAARRAQVGHKPVDLTAREWVVLESLATRPGRVVPRAELLHQGWGEASSQAASSLEVLIGRIRRKLGTELIRTLRGEGYSLESH
ncbi:MAG: response regulator transcription factor [Polyangiales bacterium]